MQYLIVTVIQFCLHIVTAYISYFLDHKTHFFSWNILYKISLYLIVRRCFSKTFKATEIPLFTVGIVVKMSVL